MGGGARRPCSNRQNSPHSGVGKFCFMYKIGFILNQEINQIILHQHCLIIPWNPEDFLAQEQTGSRVAKSLIPVRSLN